ncbi:hypothetical protein [Flaviflexus massiliensis]|uniref:hypothetical protein n=1 Tax=Flaviflexus massiliensis TaxID=1522309 RepID=UPI0006D5527A|nr:hypothetical protein [Flaviflexus massiliensis]
MTTAVEDLPTQVETTLAEEGWTKLQYGSTGALNTVVEMERESESGGTGRFIIQSRTTSIAPEQIREERITSLEIDSSTKDVSDVGTREFGAEPAFGLQYFNTDNERTTQSWYTRSGDQLLTITVDYPGEGDIPSDITAALDAVTL